MVDAVLLIGFGGPRRAEEVRPFLDNILRGRPIPKERYEEVVHHYEVMGGRSPYNEHTMRQAEALRARLRRDGIDIPVLVGMRNWNPYLVDTMERTNGESREKNSRIHIWRHIDARRAGNATKPPSMMRGRKSARYAPQVEYPDAVARASEICRGGSGARRVRPSRGSNQSEAKSAALIFTAHSIPVAMDKASGYADQIRESATAVASRLGRDSWTLAFQSRSGAPRDPWLEPDISAVIQKLDGKPTVVMPIGFLVRSHRSAVRSRCRSGEDRARVRGEDGSRGHRW